MVLGANGVAMGSHGLILCEDGATPSRNLFKCLPGLFRAFPDQKIKKITKIQEKSEYIYSLYRGRRHGRSPILYPLIRGRDGL